MNWKRIEAGEYINDLGDRVFLYPRKAFATQWGAQMAHWPQGDPAGSSLRKAKAYVEKLRASQ